eukprot:COSAG03_NODE_21150_length_308_cov_0.971292_1_plen_52_part_10
MLLCEASAAELLRSHLDELVWEGHHNQQEEPAPQIDPRANSQDFCQRSIWLR